jgi:hypothetical protein
MILTALAVGRTAYAIQIMKIFRLFVNSWGKKR